MRKSTAKQCRRRRAGRRNQYRLNHQRHRVLQPEVLEPRVLLAGDVLPNWDNNLGFDRNAIDNWGFEFVNGDPSVGSKIDYVAAGGQLHHEAVNLSVGPGDPAEGAFGYATVGRVAHAPSVSEVSSTTIWRTITLYPGETLEWAAAMIIGKDSPNFGNNGGRLDQGILSYGNYFNYSFPVGDTNGAGWTSGWQKFSYQNNTGQTIVDNIKAKAVKPYRTNNLNGSGNPRWTYRVSVAIDQVIIRDNDDAGPTISSNTGGGSDGDNNYFSWNVSDPSGVSRVDVRVYNQSTGSLVKQWLGAPAVSSIDMNDVGVGTFKMLVEA